MNSRTSNMDALLIKACGTIRENFRAYQRAKFLLKNGANPNARTIDGKTPLQQALRAKNYFLIKLLLERGANRHCLKRKLDWLLHEATRNKDLPMMQKIFSWGANIFVTDEYSYTTLMIAVKNNFYDGVKWLLKAAGGRVAELANMKADNGTTCLTAASSIGFADILELLIEHGADCNLTISPNWFPDDDKFHAIAAAALNNHRRCVELLLPHVNKEILANTALDPIFAATCGKSFECTALLLNAGYSSEVPMYWTRETDISTPYLKPLLERECSTALRVAIQVEKVEIIELLLKAGAKMTYTSKCFSPFLSVLWNDTNYNIFYQFLENNVNINAMSENRKCDVPDALLISLDISKRGQLHLLLTCGLDPSLQNWCKCKNGYSLLDDIRKVLNNADIKILLTLLSKFSPGIPGCCNEIADFLPFIPKIASLSHLCRLAIRKLFPTSKLLDGTFANKFPIPYYLKEYLRYNDFEMD
uniref:SOCS box domain-containing protein n=1 Tax=Setaria digitata TaxID=48799 RepID=A0A915Q0F6_9BILA